MAGMIVSLSQKGLEVHSHLSDEINLPKDDKGHVNVVME